MTWVARPVHDVPCPNCGSPSGARCTTPRAELSYGRSTINAAHTERFQLHELRMMEYDREVQL